MPDRTASVSCHILDLESLTVDDAWVDTVRTDISKTSKTPIGFLNWESQMGNILRNQQKLQLLRDLLAEGRCLFIQSRADPTHFKLDGETDGDSETQWEHALRSFARVYPQDDPGDRAVFLKFVDHREEQALKQVSAASQDGHMAAQKAVSGTCQLIREECQATAPLQTIGSNIFQRVDLVGATREEILGAISHAASSHYQQLWATCSQGEQYVLYTLARDGFVLSAQPEVHSLLRRGVLEQVPMLRPMNETFRRWIVAEGRYPAYAKIWARAEPEQAWKKGRQVTVALLGALGLFLYTTQQEQVSHIMEFGTALFAGIPILAEWLGKLPSGKPATGGEA
jgi:hypothetical protein